MFEGRIFECCHHTLSISTLLFGLMRDILRFIFFICRHEKLFLFFTAFAYSLGLLLPDPVFAGRKVVRMPNSELLHQCLTVHPSLSVCPLVHLLHSFYILLLLVVLFLHRLDLFYYAKRVTIL